MKHKKSTKAGTIIALVLLVLGAILTLVLISVVLTSNSLSKILIAGPCFFSTGIGMLLFPGGDVTLEELKRDRAKRLWSSASIIHKVVWIVSAAMGLAVSFKILIDAGF